MPSHHAQPRSTRRACFLASGLLLASTAAWSGDYQILPMKTRPAQTLDGITLDAGIQSFSDVTLQEADNFDGWSTDLDLRIPFMDRFQLRLYLPVYTKGDATLQKDTLWEKRGDPIHIHGSTGIYDFASIEFEHQLMFEDRSGLNLGYFAGVGSSLKPLVTNLTNGDKFNHRGRVALLGLKADSKAWDGRVRLLGNLGFRYYWESDDLNPAGDDTFGAADLKGAAVFQPWGGKLYPVLELTYLGDFGNFNVISLHPELIYPITDQVQLKAAVPIGLGGDGSQIGVSGQLGWTF